MIRTNSNGVLIDEINAFLGVHHIALSSTVYISLFDIKVSACFLRTISMLLPLIRPKWLDNRLRTSQQTCTAEFMIMFGLS